MQKQKNKFMKKIIYAMALMFLESCFLGHPRGYVNQEIKNLASPNLIIEGIEFRRVDGKSIGFSSAWYKNDPSIFIGISDHGIIPDGLRKRVPKYQELTGLKIYYGSKKCLLLNDEKNLVIYHKYRDSFEQNKILALTNNGLELLTPDQYEAAKGKYTINDKNVKCIKE